METYGVVVERISIHLRKRSLGCGLTTRTVWWADVWVWRTLIHRTYILSPKHFSNASDPRYSCTPVHSPCGAKTAISEHRYRAKQSKTSRKTSTLTRYDVTSYTRSTFLPPPPSSLLLPPPPSSLLLPPPPLLRASFLRRFCSDDPSNVAYPRRNVQACKLVLPTHLGKYLL